MTRSFLFSVLSSLLIVGCDSDKLPAECYNPAGCSNVDDTATPTPPDDTAGDDDSGDPPDGFVDDDGDGYAVEDDCNDTDADIHPDAEELCDGIDNNCVDGIDEGCDTGTTDDYAACLAEAFHGTDQTYGGTIDDSLAEYEAITNFPTSGWQWVDAEIVRSMDTTNGDPVVSTDLRIPQSGACGGSQDGGTMTVHVDVEESEKSDPDNGLIVTVQPDGSWVEINLFRTCSDDTFEGWKLPGGDGEALPICGNTAWGSGWGGHGGSHLPILPGMITVADVTSGNLDWGHVTSLEVSSDILGCPSGTCYVEPAKSADMGAEANYHGTQPMGGWWEVKSSFNCSTLSTYYVEAWCTTTQLHGTLLVDRSNENDEPEIQFVVENGVNAAILAIDGESLFNNSGQIRQDLNTLFETDEDGTLLHLERVKNPTVAYSNYSK